MESMENSLYNDQGELYNWINFILLYPEEPANSGLFCVINWNKFTHSDEPLNSVQDAGEPMIPG